MAVISGNQASASGVSGASLPASDEAWMAGYYAEVVSFQHPDHDTETWPAR